MDVSMDAAIRVDEAGLVVRRTMPDGDVSQCLSDAGSFPWVDLKVTCSGDCALKVSPHAMDTGLHSGVIDLSDRESETLRVIYGNCGYWEPISVRAKVSDMTGDLEAAWYIFEVEP